MSLIMLPTPRSLQCPNKPSRMSHHGDLTLNQIKNMDSIFSSPRKTEQGCVSIPPPKTKLGFLDLPAELRNQV